MKNKATVNNTNNSNASDDVRVTRYEEMKLENLVIERFQVRKQNVGDGLDELAASIEKYGLLQPIVVCASSTQPGKWEIVCGQRRYLAHKQILKRDTIMTGVIDHAINYEAGLSISASENVVRLDMTRKDLIDLCSELHKKYGSVKDVAEETKLPYPLVRQYIRFDGLPDDLKKKVDAKELNTDLAMKIQDAASASGVYRKKDAEQLIKVLKAVDNPMQKKILDLKKKNPTVELGKIVEKAEKPDETLKLTLNLLPGLSVPLKRYVADEDTDPKTAAESFIEAGLKNSGYMNE